MSLHEQIITDIQSALDGFGECDVMSPTLLARAVQQKYVESPLESHIEYTSLEHLKQMSRKVLAARHEYLGEDNPSLDQGEFFSGTLQDRYPLPRRAGEEPIYKRRELLTDDEAIWNATSMSRKSNALQEHSDTLMAWVRHRQARTTG